MEGIHRSAEPGYVSASALPVSRNNSGFNRPLITADEQEQICLRARWPSKACMQRGGFQSQSSSRHGNLALTARWGPR